MKAWVVRFVSLYVFNVLLLLLLGALLPNVRVGWSALWAAVILTAATIWLKPLVTRVLGGAADRAARGQSRAVQKLAQYAAVFVVQLVIWILVVIFSGVRTQGVFWAWVLPPIVLLVGWIIYDLVDDKIEARTGVLYDRASSGLSGNSAKEPATTTTPASQIGRAELSDGDGLTAEQRKLLDDLGKS